MSEADETRKGAYAFICWRDGKNTVSTMRPDDDEGKARLKQIVACCQGCLTAGIVDPATTVPELVAVCDRLHKSLDDAVTMLESSSLEMPLTQGLLSEARAVLAKTGQVTGDDDGD